MATLMPQLERLSAPSRLLPHVHALPRVGAVLSPDAMSSYAQCGESRGETNGILAFLPDPEAHDSRPGPSPCRDPIRPAGRAPLVVVIPVAPPGPVRGASDGSH